MEAEAVRGLSRCLEIDTLGYLTKQFVGSAFLLFNGFQNHRIIRKAQNLGPPAQSSIHCDLVVLDLLGCADERDVSDRRIGDVRDRIGSFGGKPVDYLASFGLIIAGTAP
jgi:hypothetical protein